MIVVQEELVEDNGSNDQVRFLLIYTTLVVQNILSDLLYYILYQEKKEDRIDFKLIDVKPISTFEFINIRSSTANRPEFPSEEFGDFMELLTKWNLSDACGSDILKFS